MIKTPDFSSTSHVSFLSLTESLEESTSALPGLLLQVSLHANSFRSVCSSGLSTPWICNQKDASPSQLLFWNHGDKYFSLWFSFPKNSDHKTTFWNTYLQLALYSWILVAAMNWDAATFSTTHLSVIPEADPAKKIMPVDYESASIWDFPRKNNRMTRDYDVAYSLNLATLPSAFPGSLFACWKNTT